MKYRIGFIVAAVVIIAAIAVYEAALNMIFTAQPALDAGDKK